MSFTAVVLVAGVGSRLRPLTDDRPKCLVPLGDGDTILSRMVRQLVAHGASCVVASTGYLDHAVRDALRDCPVPVRFAHNPDFERTQNVVSLHRALAVAPAGEVVKLDGDVVFEDRVLARLLSDPSEAQLALDERVTLGDEEMKVTVVDGFATRFGKGLDPSACAGESIGIERFGAGARARLDRAIAAAVEGGRRNIYYEDAYNDLVAEGVRMRAVTVGDLAWGEIDTPEDLRAATGLLARVGGA